MRQVIKQLLQIVSIAFKNSLRAVTKYDYRKTSSINRTKFQNLNVSNLVLQLSLLNPLKPGVKLRMNM